MTRRRLVPLALLAVATTCLAACTDDAEGSEPCAANRYDRAANVAISEELVAMASDLAAGASEEIQSITDAVDEGERPWESRSEGTQECGPDLDWAQDYLFTIHYLVAHPESASPELVTALREAASPPEPGYPPAGIDGIYNFLHDDTLYEPAYPGLAQLRSALIDRRIRDRARPLRAPNVTDVQPSPKTSLSKTAASGLITSSW